MEDNTVIIILGDHGFENIYRNFNPNFLLKKAGLIADARNGKWKAQFHTSGGSAFLQLKDKNDKATLAKVMSLLAQVPDSLKGYFRIVTKEEMTKIGADPSVALALTGLDGTSFGSKTDKITENFKKTKGTHGFFPDHKQIQTGFVAFGPGLNKGVVIPVMDMVDVAPVVAKLMGLNMKNMDGKLYTEMFK